MDTKNFIIALSLCASNLLATPCYDNAPIQCTLKGEVIDRPQTSNFILHKQFEEFRDKGLVIIGVAREKEVDTAKATIEKDEYPWENLVELNDTEKIWEKYGIGNSGGMVFLIDENGIIMATDPSVEEIRNFLIEKL